jgi:methylated-DNA-protein-cysteine methyltransferase related protein
MTDLSAADERRARLLAVVAAIPAGEVLSYAEVARRAGYPRGARLAAKALAGADEAGLPWHRVLRADGRIALPPGSKGYREQERRLRREGVVVVNGRVKLAQRDPDDLDAAIWG